jgi:hypothetical protein
LADLLGTVGCKENGLQRRRPDKTPEHRKASVIGEISGRAGEIRAGLLTIASDPAKLMKIEGIRLRGGQAPLG